MGSNGQAGMGSHGHTRTSEAESAAHLLDLSKDWLSFGIEIEETHAMTTALGQPIHAHCIYNKYSVTHAW